MPTTELDYLTEIEARLYTDEDCITDLTDLVKGLESRRLNDHAVIRAISHYRRVLELADKMLEAAAGETTWQKVLAWACEELDDTPEIQKTIKYLYDR